MAQGLFSNMYDAEQSINDAMTNTALSFGQLDRSAYAPMTASTALQGDMAGRGIGMMLGGQDPRMAKQMAIEEIMKKHPDPRTPEELDAVANDMQQNGFNDMAIKIREVANETRTAQAKATKDARPTKDLYDQISFGLTSSVLSPKFIDAYFEKMNPEYVAKYNSLTNTNKKGQYSTEQYDKKRNAAKQVLENQFKNFRNYVSRQKGMGINEINTLLSNEVLLTEAFKEWAKAHTSNEFAQFLDDSMIVGEVAGTSLNPSDTELALESNTKKNVRGMSEEEAQEKIDAYKQMLPTDFTPFMQEEFDALKEIYPQLVSAFNNPETQQWFETNFELA